MNHIPAKVESCKEPLEILNHALVETLRQISLQDISNDFQAADVSKMDLKVSLHPFLDKIYYQISKKSMSALELDQARNFLDLLIANREQVYGQDSESLLKPCESMV